MAKHKSGELRCPATALIFLCCLSMQQNPLKSLTRVCPSEAQVCAGIARCHPGNPRFTPDHPGISRLRLWWYHSLAPLSLFALVALYILIQPRRLPDSSRLTTRALWFYPCLSQFILVYHGLSNRDELGS